MGSVAKLRSSQPYNITMYSDRSELSTPRTPPLRAVHEETRPLPESARRTGILTQVFAAELRSSILSRRSQSNGTSVIASVFCAIRRAGLHQPGGHEQPAVRSYGRRRAGDRPNHRPAQSMEFRHTYSSRLRRDAPRSGPRYVEEMMVQSGPTTSTGPAQGARHGDPTSRGWPIIIGVLTRGARIRLLGVK